MKKIAALVLLKLYMNGNERCSSMLEPYIGVLQFALLETCMTAVQDTLPSLREKKTYVVLFVSILGFLGGLAVTCNVSLLKHRLLVIWDFDGHLIVLFKLT